MPSSSLVLRSSITLLCFLSVVSAVAAPPRRPTTTSTKKTTTTTTPASTPSYTIDTLYSGSTFFQGWTFFTGSDPTHGFVDYLDQSDAQSRGLISAGSTVKIGVDSTSTISPTSTGRASVRISSNKVWTHGLFIADLASMPGGICGTWPAFWTLGNGTWPYHGEIDIIEGANDMDENLSSLHT